MCLNAGHAVLILHDYSMSPIRTSSKSSHLMLSCLVLIVRQRDSVVTRT